MKKELAKHIQAVSKKSAFPDNTGCFVISAKQVIRLSDIFNIPGRRVEICALENNIVPRRYMRNMKTFTVDQQIQLLNTRIAVIGLGGLGGTTTEIFARSGIGSLKLVDGDVFEDHNLNRQLLSSISTMGVSKAAAAAKRVLKINPSVETLPVSDYFSKQNQFEILNGCDLVVDCLDNIKARFLVEDAAKTNGIPMISAAIAGFSGQVTTVFPNDTGLSAIYGPLDSIKDEKGVETQLGCPPQTVFTIASLECTEAFNVIFKRPVLRNRLLVTDLSDFTFKTLSLA